MNQRLTEKGRIKAFFCFLFLLIITMILDCQFRYPDRILLFEGETLIENTGAYTLVSDAPAGTSGVLSEDGTVSRATGGPAGIGGHSGSYEMTVKLFGIIPVRDVSVDVKPQTELVACGDCVGIKIFTKGLVCVGTQAVYEEKGGLRDISREQDIRSGDILTEVNDTILRETEQMLDAVADCNGQELSITVLREGQEINKKITPVKTKEGYQLGLWLRDSTAGVGTMTYYDPVTRNFGALGHPITDSDTGFAMPVEDGELLEAAILGVQKGEKGKPGELKGVFQTAKPVLGKVYSNTDRGVFGNLNDSYDVGEKCPVASKNSVKVGRAEILTNVYGNSVEKFEIEIQKNIGFFGGHKDMIIHVTDPELLEATGGIVQGMSGSPIIQDGKLVGAVTHVFVNDPTRGYGIFIENMLAEAG